MGEKLALSYDVVSGHRQGIECQVKIDFLVWRKMGKLGMKSTLAKLAKNVFF
jgi:hypothetical protein